MPKLELKVVNNRMILDLGKETEKGILVYDGLLHTYDVVDVLTSPSIATVDLSEEDWHRIVSLVETSGICTSCGEHFNSLRTPHRHDATDQGKICSFCWDMDRAALIRSTGEDIGPFHEQDTVRQCALCFTMTESSHYTEQSDGTVCCDICTKL